MINTFVELATKELDSHDGENEPEHKTHQQYIENRGNGVHQSIDHNLQLKVIQCPKDGHSMVN